jgi:diaminopimelate epimerase
MAITLKFDKMEGIGNDFIVTHEITPEEVPAVAAAAVRLCDRRRGIGGDGVIFILPSNRADFHMRIFNSDGSEAEMCGNGIRCCAEYIRRKSLSEARKLTIETLSGIIGTEIVDSAGTIRVNMGAPRLNADTIPVKAPEGRTVNMPIIIDNRTFLATAVSMGNPHAVIYADELTDELVLGMGPRIEVHQMFPKKTNVEFVKVLPGNEVHMRVWERGCGETQACGTGACAVVVSGIINNLHGNRVTVHLPGGDLTIEWSGNRSDPVFMTGPACVVFSGTCSI